MPSAIGPYFPVPKALIRGGIAARLGPSGVAVYIALCEHANRGNGNTCKPSDRTLAADTGVSERTISDIRKRLIELKLVECSREAGSSYVYHLLPQSKDWVPVDKRMRTKQKPRANHAIRGASKSEKSKEDTPANFATPFQQVLQYSPANVADPAGGFQ